MIKTVAVKLDVHRKLKRVCKEGRFGTLQNTIEVLLDQALSNINTPRGSSAETGVSSPPQSVAPHEGPAGALNSAAA